MRKVTLLNPRIADSTEHAPLAPQLSALRDARIAFVDNSKVNADIFLSHIRPALVLTDRRLVVAIARQHAGVLRSDDKQRTRRGFCERSAV